MPRKREAWALHLLLCALPKRPEVKSQGDWRIPRCMPADQVSRGGGGSHGWPLEGIGACVCVHTTAHAHTGTHINIYISIYAM